MPIQLGYWCHKLALMKAIRGLIYGQIMILSLTGCVITPFHIKHYNKALNDPQFTTAISSQNISVTFPSSGATQDKVRALEAVLPDVVNFTDVTLNSSSPFHAANDTARYHALTRAIHSTDTNIIWCARGGYGVSKILGPLSKLPKPTHRKIIIGYSDITALHIFVSQLWGWHTIHGANLLDILDDTKDSANFLRIGDILTAKQRKQHHFFINDLSCISQNSTMCNHHISGNITGGNLTTITTTIGTPWQIETKNKILFLEDTEEAPYIIDRCLQHLRDAGVLKNVVAVVFGTFTSKSHSIQNEKLIQYVMTDFANRSAFPVFVTKQIGHGITNVPILYDSNSYISGNHNQKEAANQVQTYTLTMDMWH